MGKVGMARKQEESEEEEEENVKQLRELLEMLAEKLKEFGINVQYETHPPYFSVQFGMTQGYAAFDMGMDKAHLVFDNVDKKVVLSKEGENYAEVDFEYYPYDDTLLIKIYRNGKEEVFEFDNVMATITASSAKAGVFFVFAPSVSARHYEHYEQ